MTLPLSLLLWALMSWRGGLMPWQAPLGAALGLGVLGLMRPVGRCRLTRVEAGLGLGVALYGALALAGTRPQTGLDEALVLACLWGLGLGWRRQRAWVEPVALTWLALSLAAGAVFFTAGWVQPARWPSDLVGPLLRPHLSSRWVAPNQNILAGTLSGPGLLLGLVLLVQGARGLRRSLAWGAVLLGGAACIYAGSRGVWLALAAAAVWLCLRWPAGGRRRLVLGLGIAALALALGARWAPFSTSRLRSQLQADPQSADSNSGRRLDFWRGAMRLSLERPLTGWGPGSFRLQALRLDLPTALDAKHPIARYRLTLEHAHDEWLELAVEAGWPMALAGLALAGGWLWRRWRRGSQDALSLGLESGLVLALVLSLTDMNLRTPGPLLGAVLVVAVLDPVSSSTPVLGRWSWPAWAGPCLGLLLLGAGVGWWQSEGLRAQVQAHAAPSTQQWAWTGTLAPFDGELAAWRLDAGLEVRPWDRWTARAEPAWWWSQSARSGQAGDGLAGIQDTRRALALRPFDAQGWFMLALQCQSLGRLDEADAAVAHSLQLEPNYCRALAWSCDRAWALGDHAGARVFYQGILRSQRLVVVQDQVDDLSLALQRTDQAWLNGHAGRFK